MPSIRIPGVFAVYLSGSSAITDWRAFDDSDDRVRRLSEAYQNARRVKAGKGESVIMTCDRGALAVLQELAEDAIDSGRNDGHHAEAAAARKVLERINA